MAENQHTSCPCCGSVDITNVTQDSLDCPSCGPLVCSDGEWQPGQRPPSPAPVDDPKPAPVDDPKPAADDDDADLFYNVEIK